MTKLEEAYLEDDSLIRGTECVALAYDSQGFYYPEILVQHECGWSAVGITRKDLRTNALLIAIGRAREWAKELGIPCRD